VRQEGRSIPEASRHDSWRQGESYDAFMGRWSRGVAPHFLDWLDAPRKADWLEFGCGTGALSAAILAHAEPAALVAVDPSEGFIARARQHLPDPRVEFSVGDAEDLDLADASRDVAVSGLVLNFVPDRARALAEMCRVLRPGGLAGFYVWDYPGRGLEFLAAFWDAAVALDPDAEALAEYRRFPFCTPEHLGGMATEAGLVSVRSTALEVETTFRDFDDYWRPFTLGAGPAPGYCASLDPAARERLKAQLDAALPRRADGAIALTARAWAVAARVP
jgi:SAM-dependent methyltransferase